MNHKKYINNEKMPWKKPEIQKLGLMKDLVQCGNAFGKSGPVIDGCSCGADEIMNGNPPNC